MSEQVETLGDALPKEIARLRDEVLPAYIAIGPAGSFAVSMMRTHLDAASKAMIEQDIIGMVQVYQLLKGYEL